METIKVEKVLCRLWPEPVKRPFAANTTPPDWVTRVRERLVNLNLSIYAEYQAIPHQSWKVTISDSYTGVKGEARSENTEVSAWATALWKFFEAADAQGVLLVAPNEGLQIMLDELRKRISTDTSPKTLERLKSSLAGLRNLILENEKLDDRVKKLESTVEYYKGKTQNDPEVSQKKEVEPGLAWEEYKQNTAEQQILALKDELKKTRELMDSRNKSIDELMRNSHVLADENERLRAKLEISTFECKEQLTALNRRGEDLEKEKAKSHTLEQNLKEQLKTLHRCSEDLEREKANSHVLEHDLKEERKVSEDLAKELKRMREDLIGAQRQLRECREHIETLKLVPAQYEKCDGSQKYCQPCYQKTGYINTLEKDVRALQAKIDAIRKVAF
jgi:chromosome segregation ATPase